MICREEAQCGSVAEGERETKHYVCSNVVMYASHLPIECTEQIHLKLQYQKGQCEYQPTYKDAYSYFTVYVCYACVVQVHDINGLCYVYTVYVCS